MWGRVPWPQAFYGVLGTTMTFFSIVVEGTFPLLVWFARTRPYVILALASLHLGIAVMLKNVTFFSLAMVCSLFLFASAAELRLLGTSLRTLGMKIRRIWTSINLDRRTNGRIVDR